MWIFKISEIKTGSSAVLGGNYEIFYTVHISAIILIIISILSSFSVIINVLIRSRKKHKFDFSIRFPIYIAIADILWGFSHLSDHLYLLIYKICPEQSTVIIFTVFLTIWLGYQQCLHAGLAIYMFLKISKNFILDMGTFEWKLHLLSLSFTASIALVVYLTNAHGCSGFWMLQNSNILSGQIFHAFSCVLVIILVFITLVSYLYIRKTVKRQSKRVNHKTPSSATQSLTTFIWISFCIYFPSVLGQWALLFESTVFGVIETSTVLLTVFASNSCGLANALGYFYNQRMRVRRKKNHLPTASNSKFTDQNSSEGMTKSRINVPQQKKIFSMGRHMFPKRTSSQSVYVPSPIVVTRAEIQNEAN